MVKIAHLIFFCLVGGMGIQQSLYSADTAGNVTHALCEYAKERYDGGYKSDARHEFQKLLMIDPNNATAKAYLLEPDIHLEIQYLQERIDSLTARISELKRIIGESCKTMNSSMVVVTLCEYAEERYKQGYMDDARHEFQKLLIMEPNNDVAKAFLDKPSIKGELKYLEYKIEQCTTRRLELEKLILSACQ
jgi:tetratricopeptide (TPR) repeat protein